jgi:ATP-dependent DNA ligase
MIQVHKAVEPDNLSVKGKKLFARLLQSLIEGTGEAVVQPKHDGIYAQIRFTAEGGWQAFSRTGQHLLSVGEDILDVFYTKGLQERVYNGELWLPMTQHQVINGKARKQSPQYLHLVLFDSFDPSNMAEPYEERVAFLIEGGGVVYPVKEIGLDGKVIIIDDLYAFAREVTQRGSAYDGLMLKDRKGEYVPGHGKDGQTIKIKPRHTGDFLVVGTTDGIGNRKGGIGALVVSLGNGITSEVGSGLSMKDVFDGDFMGKIVEVEYLGLTKDGKLREPSYQRTRWDKTEGDVITEAPTEDD